MSKFFNIGLEEENETSLSDPEGKPNELEKADNMVGNSESVDPVEVVKIANYKEELALLKEQEGNSDDETDNTESTDDTEDSGSTDDGEGEAISDNSESTDDTGDDSAELPDNETDETDSKDSEVTGEEKTDEDDKQLNEAVESFTTLKRIHSVTVKAKERNSLSVDAVKLINISLENIKCKLGVTSTKAFTLPAMEGLDTFTGRQKQSTGLVLALEGIIGDVWKAIVKMFKAIYDWVADFFFNRQKTVKNAKEDIRMVEANNSKLKKGLEKKANASATSDGPPVDTPLFKSKSAYLLLAPDVDGDDSKALAESFKHFTETVPPQIDKLNKFTSNFNLVLNELLKSQTVDEIVKVTKLISLKKLFDTTGMPASTSIKGEDLANYEAYATSVTVMNTGFYIKLIDDQHPKSADLKILSGQRYGIYNADTAGVDKKIRLIDTPAAADIVVGYLKKIHTDEENINKSASLVKDMIAFINKTIAELSNDQDAITIELVNLLRISSSILTNVSLKGYIVLGNIFNSYHKLLTQYHTESVKEFA